MLGEQRLGVPGGGRPGGHGQGQVLRDPSGVSEQLPLASQQQIRRTTQLLLTPLPTTPRGQSVSRACLCPGQWHQHHHWPQAAVSPWGAHPPAPAPAAGPIGGLQTKPRRPGAELSGPVSDHCGPLPAGGVVALPNSLPGPLLWPSSGHPLGVLFRASLHIGRTEWGWGSGQVHLQAQSVIPVGWAI